MVDMKRYFISFLTFLIVAVGSFSLGSDHDFNYSKDDHAAITSLPSIDLGPLRVVGGKAGTETFFIAPKSITIPAIKKLGYIYQQPTFYLPTYSLVTSREFHLLI